MKRRRIRLVYKKYHPEVREIIEGVIAKLDRVSLNRKFDSTRDVLATIHGEVRGRHQKIIEEYFYSIPRDSEDNFILPPDGDFITDEVGTVKYKIHNPKLVQSSIPITPECC